MMLKTLIFVVCLCGITAWDHFRFSRNIDCLKEDRKGYCKDWSQTTILYHYSEFIYYCFPGNLYVLTSRGPIQMKELTIHDQIFGMNLQTGRNQFSNVVAWLHHDPLSLVDYSQIQIQSSSWKFLGSSYHNIAFSNSEQTDFKFLKDLSKGDNLISITEDGLQLQVESTKNKVEKQGLYSPFTSSGTFYIYPQSFDVSQFQKGNDYPMILVNSLSQIKNPKSNFKTASMAISLLGSIFGHHQPSEDEQYVNPLISQLRIIFSGDWVDAGGQKIYHRTSSYSSYSSTRNRRKQERERKTMVVLAMETVLSDTLL